MPASGLATSQLYEIATATIDDTDGLIETARLDLVGESEHTGRDLLAVALDGDDADQSAHAEAGAFLRAELADGPRPAKDVAAAAKQMGISALSSALERRSACVRRRRSRRLVIAAPSRWWR